MTKQTLLQQVRQRIQPLRHAELQVVARETGVSYDTLRRMKSDDYDPAFSRVQKLAEYFRYWLE